MRRRHLRRSSGRRRIPEWRMAFGATDGFPYLFNTQSLVSHWAVWPVGTFDDSNENVPFTWMPNPTDLTLVRSINQFSAWVEAPDVTGGLEETDSQYTLGFGLIKFAHPNPTAINGQVFVSGDQVPGPITNPTMDWVWRGLQSNRSFGAVSQQAGLAERDMASQVSRAMRKLSQNEGLLQVLEFRLWNSHPLTNNSREISWYFESRMLLKEA